MFRLVSFVAAMIVLALIGYLLSRPALNEGALEQTRQAILAQTFTCPAGTTEELKRWHLDGYVRRCVDENKQTQGPMIGWRAAHLAVTGNYRDGVRDGEWLWYRAKGGIARSEAYRMGRRMNDNQTDDK